MACKGDTITFTFNHNAGTDEEEKKLAGPLAKNWLKDALGGMVNGKKVRGRRRYQMIDRSDYDKWTV